MPGIHVLCPTRWTVWTGCFKSILENYTVLIDLCRESSEHVCDAETKARIQGVAAQMRTFDVLKFDGVWLRVTTTEDEFDVSKPTLLHRCKTPHH